MLRLGLVGIGAAALVAGGAPSETTSQALWFVPTQQRPVAGQGFTGLVLEGKLSVANCGNATVGHSHISARRRSVLESTPDAATVCSWRLPKGTSGKQLRVTGALAANAQGEQSSVPAYGWIVR